MARQNLSLVDVRGGLQVQQPYTHYDPSGPTDKKRLVRDIASGVARVRALSDALAATVTLWQADLGSGVVEFPQNPTTGGTALSKAGHTHTRSDITDLLTSGILFASTVTAQNGTSGQVSMGDLGGGVPGFLLGNLGDTNIARVAAGVISMAKLAMGGTQAVSNALVTSLQVGNGLEFGHPFTGLRSALGGLNDGRGFIAFGAEASTDTAGFRTRAIVGSVITNDLAGGLLFGQAASAAADNQTMAVLASLSPLGQFNAKQLIASDSGTGVLLLEHAGAGTDAKWVRLGTTSGVTYLEGVSDNFATTIRGFALTHATGVVDFPTATPTAGGVALVKTNDSRLAVNTQYRLQPARAAAPKGTNITLSAPGATIDGVTMATSDRLLLQSQTTPSQNGLWIWNGASSALTRPTDYPAAGTVRAGTEVYVQEGTARGQQLFHLATTGTVTVDTTSQDWDPNEPAKDNKKSVKVCSTTNVTVSAPGASIDGVTLSNLDSVLLVGQTTPAENGIYLWTGAATAMVRSGEANTSAKVSCGMEVYVAAGGTANGNTDWRMTVADPITLGTTGLVFSRFDMPTSPWIPIMVGHVNLTAAAAAVYAAHQGVTANVLFTTTFGPLTQYINPAVYAIPGRKMKMRLVASFMQNTVANAGTSVATAGLYPLTAGGTTTTFTPTTGTVVSGSTAAVTGGAASAEQQVVSSEFDAPAADTYGLGVAITTATTAGATRISLRLEYRMV